MNLRNQSIIIAPMFSHYMANSKVISIHPLITNLLEMFAWAIDNKRVFSSSRMGWRTSYFIEE